MIENIKFPDLSAFPLLSAFFLEEDRHIITGSTDGQVGSWGTQHWEAQKTETLKFHKL